MNLVVECRSALSLSDMVPTLQLYRERSPLTRYDLCDTGYSTTSQSTVYQQVYETYVIKMNVCDFQENSLLSRIFREVYTVCKHLAEGLSPA